MSTTAGAAAAAAPSTGGQNAAAPSNEQQQAQQQQQQQPNDPIVQWVVLRRDLWGGASGWPLGPIVAQACHASAAALFAHLDDPDTQAYVAPNAIDGMHKVVLEVKTEAQLRSLSGKLEAAGVAHKLWVEQPEDVPTALATKPYRRSAVAQHFKKLQLCKAAVGGAGGGGNGGNGGGGGGGTTSGGE
jgi:peptidyl-tRNA hydrolase